MYKKLEDRLSVYKKVLTFLESDDACHGVWKTPKNAPLSVLLACAWQDISWKKNFIDLNGEYYGYDETFNYFPEINDYYNKGCVIYCDLFLKNTIQWRIKILKEIINKK